MEINNTDTIKHIISRLKEGKRVCYVRYGDGDYIAMYPKKVGTTIGSANKSFITNDIRKGIIESYNIESEDYLISVIQKGKNSTVSNIDFNIIKKQGLKDINPLYSAIAIQQTLLDNPDLFLEFSRLINKKKTLYVNQYSEPILNDFLGEITHHIKVPKYNACAEHKNILNIILSTNKTEYDQIILSCGQLTRVIMKDLYENLPDKNIFDIGSVSDMLIVNTPSFENLHLRSHIKKDVPFITERVEYLKKHL